MGSGRHVRAKPARACVWSSTTSPSWETVIVGKRISWSVHSSSRPRGGAGSLGRNRFGETQRNGASARIRIPIGRAAAVPLRRCASTRSATKVPSRAAMSAVSTGCRTFPAAKTPCWLVRSAVSTTGPRVPGSISMPALRASSWSGIQSPVKIDGVAVDYPAGAGVEVLHLNAAQVWLADDPHDAGAGGDRDPQQRFAGHVECGVGLRGRVFGGHRDGGTSGVSQCHHRRPADQLGADDDGTFADLAVVQVHDVLKLPGGVDARWAVSGNQPGRVEGVLELRWP